GLLTALVFGLPARELLLLAPAHLVLLALLFLHAALLLGLLALLVGLDAALLLVDPPLLRLCALPLGVVARALAILLAAGALMGGRPLCPVGAALLVHQAALVLSVAPPRFVVPLLARRHVAPELLVLPAACVPVLPVLRRASFRLSPLEIVVTAVL